VSLVRLRREVAEDRHAMANRLADLKEAGPRLGEPPWTSHAAVAVHGWYSALEAALERIVRALDGDVPQGDRWHRDLLSQATVELPDVRPPVLPRELLPELLELLAFRHFFRHAYSVPIDPDRLAREMERPEAITPQVDEALDAIQEYLGATIDALRGENG